MLALVVFVALWRAPRIVHLAHAGSWLNAVLVALVLVPLTFVDPNAMRIVQYYSIFLVLLVPAILQSFSDYRERALAYLVAGAFLLALFIRSGSDYIFYWQLPR